MDQGAAPPLSEAVTRSERLGSCKQTGAEWPAAGSRRLTPEPSGPLDKLGRSARTVMENDHRPVEAQTGHQKQKARICPGQCANPGHRSGAAAVKRLLGLA